MELKLSDYPEQPGIFNSSLKLLKSAKQLIICHSGLRFDSYMGNCSHWCSYCYARSQNTRLNRWDVENIKIANLNEIKEIFKKAHSQKNKYNELEKCLRHKYPIRLGTQTDCFQLCENKYHITYQFIKNIMNKYNYPYIICTKNKMVVEPEFMNLYKDNVIFQFTLSTLKQDFLNKLESGASTAIERIETMRKLSDKGFNVSCRISPHIPEYMDDLEELIEKLSQAGCKHIISELLRISPISNKIMIKETNFDVADYYTKMGVKIHSNYYRYPLDKKIKYQKKLKLMCDKHNMTFATCGDEDPSFHTVKNCCGTDNLKAFQGCSMATYDTAFNICKKQGEISFEDLTENNWCPDKVFLKEMWEKGYFETVLMNFQYNAITNKYVFVECNQTMRNVNPNYELFKQEEFDF